MSVARKVKVGLFGVGRMGSLHLQTLLSLGDKCEVVCIGDRHPPSLQLAKQMGIGSNTQMFSDSSEMARAMKGDLDCVITAGKTSERVSDCLPLLQQGIPVLADKPLGSDIAELASLIQQTGEDDRRVMQVGFHRYFDDCTHMALEWQQTGVLGHLQCSRHWIQDKNPCPAGYQSPGLTADIAIHVVFESLMFNDFCMPSRVRATKFASRMYDDAAGEGGAVMHALMEYPNGVVSHLFGSRINHMGYDNGFSLQSTLGRCDVGEFVGDFGDISAKLYSDGVLTSHVTRSMTPESEARMPGPVADFFPRFYQAYRSQAEDFIDCVRDGREFQVTQKEGWLTCFLASALDVSSNRDGQVIETGGIDSIEQAVRLAKDYEFYPREALL